MGDSRGHWEGDSLVVDVTNFTDNTWPVGHDAHEYACHEGNARNLKLITGTEF